MGYYFVLEISNNGKVLLLENLADKKQIEAELIAFDTLVQNSKVKSLVSGKKSQKFFENIEV